MSYGRPSTTTWECRSPAGLISTGFIAASGSTRAAAACIAWARPISPPSAVTMEFSAMFCALNGATRTPRRASHRHRPATTTLFPAPEVVPATRSAPFHARGVAFVLFIAGNRSRNRTAARRRGLSGRHGGGGPVRRPGTPA